MSLAKHISKGIIVKSALTATPTTVLGQIESADYSPGLRTLLDSTTHDNANTKSYVDSGLKDTPDADLVLLVDPADARHAEVITAQYSGATYYMTFTLPAGTPSTIALIGVVLDAAIRGMTTNGLLKLSVKYKATAAEVFTP